MGMVFERATGRTVTQWLDQTLWAPLGAQNAGSFSIDSVAGGFEKMESGLNGTPIDIIRLGVLYLMVVPSLDIVVARFGRQYALGAPRGNSGGGVVGHLIWPEVLARVATTVAASAARNG